MPAARVSMSQQATYTGSTGADGADAAEHAGGYRGFWGPPPMITKKNTIFLSRAAENLIRSMSKNLQDFACSYWKLFFLK